VTVERSVVDENARARRAIVVEDAQEFRARSTSVRHQAERIRAVSKNVLAYSAAVVADESL